MTSSNNSFQWTTIYKIGAVAAISVVVLAILEILIIFLPGGDAIQETVLDWFNLFQSNPLLGLRNLGLINILINIMGIFTFFGLYAAHRENKYQPVILLTVVISFIGLAIFFATNRAFPMWALSSQYAAVSSDAQRAAIEAAGLAMLSVGQSHTPGTFLGFFFTEISGLIVSFMMLKGEVFNKANAIAGMVAFGFMLVFEISASFGPGGLNPTVMMLAMIGGIATMAWYVMIARTLFRLAKKAYTKEKK